MNSAWTKIVGIVAFVLSAGTFAADQNSDCPSCPSRRAAPLSTAALSVGANVNTSKKSGYQAETAIAINPTDPTKLVLFSNEIASGASGIFRAYSTDGGQSWTSGDIATGKDGMDSACCDPTCCYDKFGTLFFCYLTGGKTTGTVVFASTDNGVTFTKVGSTLAVGTDQPTIVSGPGTTPGSSTVWVLYTDSNGDQVVQGMETTGLGKYGSFSAPVTVPGSNGEGFGDIAIGPAGQVVVVFQNTNSGDGPDTILSSVKADGLGTGGFTTPATASSTNVGGFDNITPQPNRSVDSEAGLAIDTTGGPFSGRTYMVYTDETPNESSNTDILFRYSDNFGATWSAPLKLNDDATTNAQFFPKIALDKTTGAIAVAWMDCRNDPGSGPFDRDGKANTDALIYATVSANGGTSFATNVRVSSGSTNSQLQSDLGNEFGDYIGIAFHGGHFFPAWPDNSNSTGDNPDGLREFDIYTADVAVAINAAGTVPTTTTAANAVAGFSTSAQSIPLSAMISPSAVGGVNEGSVTFQIMNGNAPVGTATTSGTVSEGVGGVLNYTLPAGLPAGTYTIVATYNGTANFASSSDNTHTLTVSLTAPVTPAAPFFASPPIATPNPATPGQTVQFSAAAASTVALTYAWDFGDGTNGSGPAPTHAYVAQGTFNVIVTAMDASSQTATSMISVAVNPAVTGIAVLPGEIDSDGDGFSNAIESLAKTDPLDPTDTPAKGAAPVKYALTVTKVKVSKQGRATINGTMAVPGGFIADGTILIADIAGDAQSFVLSKSGSGRNGKDSFRVALRQKSGAVIQQTAKFTLTLNSVSNNVVTGAPMQIVVGNQVFSTTK